MEFFVLEHKRLWRTPRVWICVLLCFIYCVGWGGLLSYQWFDFGTPDDPTKGIYGNKFDGYSAIRNWQELADSFGDYWTDETLPEMVETYRSMQPDAHLQSGADWVLALEYLRDLYPELEDPEDQPFQPLMLYADTSKMDDFYGRRAELLEFTLETTRQNEGMTQADKDMLLEMNSQIEEPWRYEWVHGWDEVTNNLSWAIEHLAPYLAIALAFVFSGEWHNNTAPVLHTTKYGWKKLARVKIMSGLAFAVELYLLVIGCHVALQLIYLGTDGWDMPIQFMNLLAVAPWNMLQAELYHLAFGFLGVIGYAGLVMLMSALVKNNVLALVYSLAFIYVPDILTRFLPNWLKALSQYFPLVGSSFDYLTYNVFHIFGKGIWSPWMLITVPFLIGIVCIPFAVRGWARRQRV